MRFTIHSRLVHRDLHEILVVPAGGGERELLVFLHGRGSAPASNLRQPLFDVLHDLGPRAPVVLLADGGDHSYWHDRSDGACHGGGHSGWSARMGENLRFYATACPR